MEKIYHANSNHKRAGMTSIRQNRLYNKNVIRDNMKYFIRMSQFMRQITTIITIHIPMTKHQNTWGKTEKIEKEKIQQ